MRRILRARRRAQSLLNELGIKRPPLDVNAIAKRIPTLEKIEEVELDDEISGALLPVEGGKWLIVVNSFHTTRRRRFTIAHELGHLLLHQYTAPHADRRMKLRDARSSEGSAQEEIEANQFAAELLMPREWVLDAVRGRTVEYEPDEGDEEAAFEDLVKELAAKFDVSTHAMTIRLSGLYS